ncbi:hypothetical protein [Domibacillus aminovorans]|uniref:Uncharacterized protein n=1 Tax=Domibacillus aminovorans TaxID=29332 RepID=A0A177L431_9BACI|nr:hypothetical protein [Domibacillus aminovorans]OAH59521.1 hypothetical protein AWH49_18380 [Domibacillus aminovorans]
MNEHLLEILTREIVASLSVERRQLYQFIVHLEDELAQQAETSDHFLSLLVKHAPHEQAAKHFNRSHGETIKLMKEIEKEIDEKLQLKIKKAKWIDCTKIIAKKRGRNSQKTSLYLFVI